MNILRRILGRTIESAWELSPGGTVWKVQPSESKLLLGEARDLTAKRVSFFSINPLDGSVKFKGVATDEPWWDALEFVIGDVAVIHRYPKPDMPSVLGATAIDVETGAMLWHRDNIRVLCGTAGLLLAERTSSDSIKDLVILDSTTGAELEEHQIGSDRCIQFANSCVDDARFNGWVSATLMSEDDPKFNELTRIVDQTIKDRMGPVEVAEFEGYTVLSAHGRSRESGEAMLNNRVDNTLMILNRDRDVVYNRRITTGAPAPSEDSFFIWNGILMFILDRQTIVGINLDR